MTMTSDDTGPAADTPPAATSEMMYGAGQSAWLALMSVVALLGLALAVVALVVAGSDDGGGSSAASDGAPSGPVGEAEISATEFAFDPADVELFADEEVSVTLTNDGAVEHNWTVIEQGTTVTSEEEIPDAPKAGEVATIAAGEDGSTTLTLEAGEYQVVCTIAGHFAAGMEGTVVASAPAA